MTPKQIVLKKHPKAHAWCWAGPAWVIYAGNFAGDSLNVSAPTARQAWAEAAKDKSVKRTDGDGGKGS